MAAHEGRYSVVVNGRTDSPVFQSDELRRALALWRTLADDPAVRHRSVRDQLRTETVIAARYRAGQQTEGSHHAH
jgi:hypothetical protein